jgi:hypothetical protein
MYLVLSFVENQCEECWRIREVDAKELEKSHVTEKSIQQRRVLSEEVVTIKQHDSCFAAACNLTQYYTEKFSTPHISILASSSTSSSSPR